MPITSKVIGSSEITDGSIVNTDINASANIAISKISSTDITTAARTVLDDATVSAMLDTLGGTAATGTGAVVRATSPTLVTPTLGVAGATSINFGQDALSYYDEGTFTPTVTLVGGAGNTIPVYTINTGLYTRIGNRVFVTIYLQGDGGDEGAGTGRLNVALPFTVSASQTFTIIPGYLNNSGSVYMTAGIFDASGTTMRLSYYPTAVDTIVNVTGAEQNSTTRYIMFNFSYQV